MSTKLTYTKAIKNGKLKATEMEIGSSVTGTLKEFKQGKDFGKGPSYNPVLEVQGRDVEIYAAGNIKFLKRDVDEGKRALGDNLVITRKDDVISKAGFTMTQFDINASQGQAPQASTSSVKEKLEAIRAKQGAQ